jgi:membrane protease subunit HflC
MEFKIKSNYVLFAALFFAIFMTCYDLVFSVNEKQYAVVFQFSKAVRTVSEPGLNVKIPFIQTVKYFDKRILSVQVEAKELTALDGKRIIVDAFARFKILQPVEFYKKVSDNGAFALRLNKILESSMRKVIGKIYLSSLLSEERAQVMKKIEDLLNEEVGFFGVVVIDVRILRADLPKENSAAIYKRMQTEREKEAKQIRAEGFEEALKIRSLADKDAQIIIADAYLQSQTIKSEADTQCAKIYNEAYSRDPDFYKFYKSINTYKNTLKKDDTNFVLSADSELFQYLNLKKANKN